jgi:hypothetical protein
VIAKTKYFFGMLLNNDPFVLIINAIVEAETMDSINGINTNIKLGFLHLCRKPNVILDLPMKKIKSLQDKKKEYNIASR